MQYKFKNQHALAVIAILVFIVIVGRMSFRSRTYVSDLSLVSWMLAVVAITSACASYFFRARLLTICLLSGIVGSAFTWIRPATVSCLNCFFEIREAGIANGETFYINSNENFILVAVSLSIVSIVFGGLVGTAIAKYRAWLEVNSVSFLVLVVAISSTGWLGFEFGEALMPRVSHNFAAAICALIGLCFSIAWIYTNRPFVKPKTDLNYRK